MKWGDTVGEGTVAMMQEILEKTRAEDSVRGNWLVPKLDNMTLWYDAGSIVIGVVLEIGGASFKKQTATITSISLRGVNLALKWGLHSIEI